MKNNQFQPQLDVLEERATPATFSLSAGVLSIQGTNNSDHVTVKINRRGTIQTADDRVEVTAFETAGYSNFVSYKRSLVSRLSFDGLDGNDTLLNKTSLPCTAMGGNGNDYFESGRGADWFYGGEGDDTIWAGLGNDMLYGDNGNDTLYGQGGNDWLFGGEGHDTLWGGIGNDNMYGAGGIDTLHGSAGNDTLDGGRDWTKDNMYGEGDGDVFRKHRYPFGATNHIIEPETDDYQSRTGDTYQVVDNSIVAVPVIKPGLMISIKK